jgi:hypothetical protein
VDDLLVLFVAEAMSDLVFLVATAAIMATAFAIRR